MVKVITYGTYDLLHYGHVRLLERAKALGDYLIVGVTSDDYDKTRGKINIQQSLMERLEAVRATGLADEIIIEEYEGQKIDDIKRYDIDIFTVGSDWKGYFDYLKEYCDVVYLPRTEGISSTDIRENKRAIKMGLAGDSSFLNKVWNESNFVNGIYIEALYTKNPTLFYSSDATKIITDSFDYFLNVVDAVYLQTNPNLHYSQIKQALNAGKHVLCESPLTLNTIQTNELIELAKRNNLIFMEAIKTAYATAYERLLLLIKAGKIGNVISIDSTCTSLRINSGVDWSCIYEWGPTALLPVFQIFGTKYNDCQFITKFREDKKDSFSRINFIYSNGCASVKVGDGFKSEGDLIVSGSNGYIYVPAPWWKTDYFEIRYEDPSLNRRYYYQLDGEGIRYELVAFARAIEHGNDVSNVSRDISLAISEIMNKFSLHSNMVIV